MLKNEINVEIVDMDIIRGDSLYFGIEITSPVSPATLLFTVKESLSDKTPVLQKNLLDETSSSEEGTDGDIIYTYIVKLKPEETRKLSLREYYYDIQLATSRMGNDDVYTIMLGKMRVHYDVTR